MKTTRLKAGWLALSGLMAIAVHAAEPSSAPAYTLVPELEARLPAEPQLPASVCTTLSATFRQENGRLPVAVDADPAHSQPDSGRIQRAIDACAAGQAVRLVADAANNAFLAGPIRLKSGVKLWIDGGVTLFASRSPRDYDVGQGPDAGYCGSVDAKHKNGCDPWITATDTVNSGIVGDGVIDGRGGAVLTSGKYANRVTWWDLSIQSKAKPTLQQNNPRMLQVNGGRGFTLYRVSIVNAPKFHVGTLLTDGFIAWGVKLVTPSLAYSVPAYRCPAGTYPRPGELKVSTCFMPENVKNTDGIDPGNSTNVTIAYSFISTGDDHIALKSGSLGGKPSRHHLYAHDRLYYGHGLSIGSETDAGIDDVQVWDLVIDGMDSPLSLGVRVKSDASRGGEVRGMLVREVCMRREPQAIVIDPYYSAETGSALPPYFHDITFRNFHYVDHPGAKYNQTNLVFSGWAEGNVTKPASVTLDNVHFDTDPVLGQEHYHDVQFVIGRNTNIVLPVGEGISRASLLGWSRATKPCPDEIFSRFPSPLAPF